MSNHHLRRTRPDCSAETTSVDQINITTHHFPDDGVIPNNPTLAVVIMAGALAKNTKGSSVMSLLENNNWRRVWQASVFEYQHYHPTAHEVLVCVSGWADLQLGGPSGDIFRVIAGDALILPAGTGHCLLDARSDFSVCGGYPAGQEDRKIVRGIRQNREGVVDAVANVTLPSHDPIYGENGPLLKIWEQSATD